MNDMLYKVAEAIKIPVLYVLNKNDDENIYIPFIIVFTLFL